MLRKCIKIFIGVFVIVVTLMITENEAYATIYSGTCGAGTGSDASRVGYALDSGTGELSIYANASGDCYMRDFDLDTASEWLAHKNDIVSVTITGRVMNIGACAFRNCTNLVSVSIPNAVINDIGDYAFNNCFDIQQVQINSNITVLNNGDFKDCTSMNSISINSTVTDINGTCFRNCKSLPGVSLPSGLDYIGSQAFMDCAGLLNITIPQGVTDIHYQTFKNCTSLRWIKYKSGTNVSGTAFEGCSSFFEERTY